MQQKNATNFTSSNELCEKETEGDMIAHAVFLSVVMALTLFGNFLVIGTVATYRKLRTVTNYFVISLAVSDVLVGLTTLPLKIDQMTHNKKWCHGMELCTSWIIADIVCNCASIWNLVLISVDRAIAIFYPFQYREMITKKKAVFFIVVVWTGSFLMGFLGMLNWTSPGKEHIFTVFSCQKGDRIYYTVAATVGFFMPLVIILISYGFVFSIALSQAKAVAQASTTRRNSLTTVHFLREFKAGKTLAIVVGAFIICWLPFFTILLVTFWAPMYFYQWSTRNKLAFEIVDVTFIYFLTSINSSLNPFIYALFNTEFRRGFLKFFFKIIGVKAYQKKSGEGRSGSISHSSRRRSSTPLTYLKRNSSV